MCSFLSFWIFCSKVLIVASCCFLSAFNLNYTISSSAIYFYLIYFIFRSSIYCWIYLAFSYSWTLTRFLCYAWFTFPLSGVKACILSNAAWEQVILWLLLRTMRSIPPACPLLSWLSLWLWVSIRSWTDPTWRRTIQTSPSASSQFRSSMFRTIFWDTCFSFRVPCLWSALFWFCCFWLTCSCLPSHFSCDICWVILVFKDLLQKVDESFVDFFAKSVFFFYSFACVFGEAEDEEKLVERC